MGLELQYLLKPEIPVFVITMVTFLIYLTSISLDQWIVLHHGNSRVAFIGIFYTYRGNESHLGEDIETNAFFQHYVQEHYFESPAWIHMARFMVVCGMISVGYSLIISVAILLLPVNYFKSPMLMNIVGGLFMLIALCHFPA